MQQLQQQSEAQQVIYLGWPHTCGPAVTCFRRSSWTALSSALLARHRLWAALYSGSTATCNSQHTRSATYSVSSERSYFMAISSNVYLKGLRALRIFTKRGRTRSSIYYEGEELKGFFNREQKDFKEVIQSSLLHWLLYFSWRQICFEKFDE